VIELLHEESTTEHFDCEMSSLWEAELKCLIDLDFCTKRERGKRGQAEIKNAHTKMHFRSSHILITLEMYRTYDSVFGNSLLLYSIDGDQWLSGKAKQSLCPILVTVTLSARVIG